ncbi:MAG: Na+/H+ antiporter NhaA [Neomegalonema sp.]|nr:Na+/H+ antiporter NhaA [Neomegalonema sp.]
MRKIVTTVNDFLKLESASGILLMGAAVLALIANNSFASELYTGFLTTDFGITLGTFKLQKDLYLWINDGLMAIFFFLVGLEIKREVLEGELSSLRKASLPLFAALGGVVAPALIYVLLNSGDAQALRGWAIPAATDIAFALGVLALLGSRVPTSLKVFLLAIAIIDDLAAIVIIAAFYTEKLSMTALGLSAIGLVALAVLNYRHVTKTTPYILIGVFVWVCVLKSGIHATLAGVMIAMAIPLKGKKDEGSPLHRLEHDLHPYVAYLVLPIFAFANAGVSFASLSLSDAAEPIPLGIMLGLFIGKQIGVFGAAFAAVSLGLASRPDGASWKQIYAVAILCGIGFTMSLFIGGLAFEGSAALNNAAKLGILAGSTISAIAGYLLLRASVKPGTAAATA